MWFVSRSGFIDLHSHCMNNDSARLQACDGVTTQLELELGTWPVDTFLAQREVRMNSSFV